MTPNLRVAMIAPPWLSIPPKGYGGIEAVLDGLISGLKKRGIKVELFSVGQTKIRGVKVHSIYETGQYDQIHKPMYEALPIIASHLQFALNTIKADGRFDVIHDHNGFLGPQVLGWATQDKSMPPSIHTLHGPPFSNEDMLNQGLPDNRPMWQQLAALKSNSYIVGISSSLMANAPEQLKSTILPTVYNAVDVNNFPFVTNKKNYFFTLARFSRDKGQHIAARICVKQGYNLRMAGTVAGIETAKSLSMELANPLSPYRHAVDFRYYSDQILPYIINNNNIVYLGNISGKRKLTLMSNAKALLFPIDWEEPFGMAVIEALACGTPVVAMNRGAMPEIITHGVNGFLAETEAEFAEYMGRVNEINPEACRQSVIDKFSADVMAGAYIDRYHEAMRRSA